MWPIRRLENNIIVNNCLQCKQHYCSRSRARYHDEQVDLSNDECPWNHERFAHSQRTESYELTETEALIGVDMIITEPVQQGRAVNPARVNRSINMN